MGYTNYWHQYNDFTDEEWKSILQEYDYIKEVLENNGIIVDETTDKSEIRFNGRKDKNEYEETFVLNKDAKPYNTPKTYEGEDLSFNFCKTRMQPYDIAVWYLLTQIQRICPSFSISRDYP